MVQVSCMRWLGVGSTGHIRRESVWAGFATLNEQVFGIGADRGKVRLDKADWIRQGLLEGSRPSVLNCC